MESNARSSFVYCESGVLNWQDTLYCETKERWRAETFRCGLKHLGRWLKSAWQIRVKAWGRAKLREGKVHVMQRELDHLRTCAGLHTVPQYRTVQNCSARPCSRIVAAKCCYCASYVLHAATVCCYCVMQRGLDLLAATAAGAVPVCEHRIQRYLILLRYASTTHRTTLLC